MERPVTDQCAIAFARLLVCAGCLCMERPVTDQCAIAEVDHGDVVSGQEKHFAGISRRLFTVRR